MSGHAPEKTGGGGKGKEMLSRRDFLEFMVSSTGFFAVLKLVQNSEVYQQVAGFVAGIFGFKSSGGGGTKEH